MNNNNLPEFSHICHATFINLIKGNTLTTAIIGTKFNDINSQADLDKAISSNYLAWAEYYDDDGYCVADLRLLSRYYNIKFESTTTYLYDDYDCIKNMLLQHSKEATLCLA